VGRIVVGEGTVAHQQDRRPGDALPPMVTSTGVPLVSTSKTADLA
jgi:hypothetical protein